MARTRSYGYYSLSTNKYGRAVLYPGEGPWYGGRLGGDPAISNWVMYGLNYAPPVPENLTIEYYPTTSDPTPIFLWTATALEDEGLQYQIQINFNEDVFTNPTQDLGTFSATDLAGANKTYATPIENALILEGTYYARIRATDGITWSEWTSSISFEYVSSPPPTPTIDPVTTPTDSFVQLIQGSKDTDVYVFIRNNGGDWIQVSYAGDDRSGTRWYYSLTLDSGSNVIEVVSTRTNSIVFGMSPPASATIITIFETPEAYNVWNCFDELGLLVGLDRNAAEKNKAYKLRILDVFQNPGNATYQGLINGISRELAIDSSDVTIYRLSDLAASGNANNILNADGNAIGTKLEDYADEVYSHNPIFWGTAVSDESVWDSIDEEWSGVSFLPHLWDPTASGIYNKWQKPGIGDQDDLWVNDMIQELMASGVFPVGDAGSGMMTASGVQRLDMTWRAPVHSGFFYITTPLLRGSIPSSLIFQYNLNDNAASTDVTDVFGINGTASRNTSLLYKASGKVNSCFSFDSAESDYIDTNQTFQSTLQGSFSISFWLRLPADWSGNKYFCSTENAAGADTLILAIGSAGFPQFYYTSNGNQVIRGSEAGVVSKQNLLNHYLMVADSTISGPDGIKIYMNAQYLSPNTNTGDTTDVVFSDFATTRNLVIGCRNVNGSIGNYATCDIDIFEIFNSALTAEDAVTLYNSGNGTELSSGFVN